PTVSPLSRGIAQDMGSQDMGSQDTGSEVMGSHRVSCLLTQSRHGSNPVEQANIADVNVHLCADCFRIFRYVALSEDVSNENQLSRFLGVHSRRPNPVCGSRAAADGCVWRLNDANASR